MLAKSVQQFPQLEIQNCGFAAFRTMEKFVFILHSYKKANTFFGEDRPSAHRMTVSTMFLVCKCLERR